MLRCQRICQLLLCQQAPTFLSDTALLCCCAAVLCCARRSPCPPFYLEVRWPQELKCTALPTCVSPCFKAHALILGQQHATEYAHACAAVQAQDVARCAAVKMVCAAAGNE